MKRATMTQGRKKQLSRSSDEGWLPSRQLLAQLAQFGPSDWYERLAALAVREGLLKTPSWNSSLPGELQDLKNAGWEITEELEIEGHEHGLDLPLLWGQLVGADQVVIDSAMRFEFPSQTDNWERRFLDNELPMTISAPAYGIAVDVSAWTIFQALIKSAPGGYHVKGSSPFEHPALSEAWHWIKFSDTVEGRMWALEVLSVGLEHLRGEAEHVPTERITSHFAEAGRHILREQGYLRGPCPRCGRAYWFITEPKQKGRPPLVYQYCPVCVEIIKRAQSAERTRRSRENKTRQ